MTLFARYLTKLGTATLWQQRYFSINRQVFVRLDGYFTWKTKKMLNQHSIAFEKLFKFDIRHMLSK